MDSLVVPIDPTEQIDSGGNEKGPYVAEITGPGKRYRLERKFLRNRIDQGRSIVLLPKDDGVYEIRDFVEGRARFRYYQVMGGEALSLPDGDADSVLEAVALSRDRVWAIDADPVTDSTGVVDGDRLGGTASTFEVLEVIDRSAEELTRMVREGSFDEEDVEMELDKIRRVVERL